MIDQVVQFFFWLIKLGKPENLAQIANLGGPWWVSYVILTSIIFAETGLLVGFFLPGDSLLFAAGFLASQGVFHLIGLNITLIIAAIAGDAVNFHLGLTMTERVFERGRLKMVKYEHLIAAKVFYEKYGAIAIVLARFVPIVRTFTPFVAGVGRMPYQKFVFYNVVGGVGWIVSMTSAGYWLGQIPWIQKNFELVVIGIVILSVMPIVAGAARHWWAQRTLRQELSAK